jgi:hypothetical protein
VDASLPIVGAARVLRPDPQEAAVADPTPTPNPTDRELTRDPELERFRSQRAELKNRHARALSRLMDEREDLKGVHALADLVSDSLRWSA